ncbi:hypothetical protein [Pseudomonas serbica]|uniref:hypothetical protein n=1 Tax=Pseudomonas serbica TaxID=2965074 RepID=UPI00237A5B29|nr:hypothetical protein [Pseudomonas serbica]
MLTINKELYRLAVLDEPDPIMVHALISDFIQGMDDLASQRLHVLVGKAATMMDTTILDLFKRPAIAEVISELYFQHFQAPIRLVFSIAAGPEGQLLTDAYSDELRDALVARGVENLIAYDAFSTDADQHLMDSLIIYILRLSDNPQPALDLCDVILERRNDKKAGIDVIFTALFQAISAKDVKYKFDSARPLLQWMQGKQADLVKQMVNARPGIWMANELTDIFQSNELQDLADRWYLRSSYLDFQRLYAIHQRCGLKPDQDYLQQFIAHDCRPSQKQLGDLLKYSLAVENFIPDASKLTFKPTWVTKSLVDAFNTFREMGIEPRSPKECEPLISLLAGHLKSEETMTPLMAKEIQPYIAISNSFQTKMFGMDLGL